MPVIEVNHVTKEYRLGVLHNFKHTLQNIGARLRGERIPKPEPFKALDDVDFKVEEGEVVGIIGHNGAGKSTLLKHLAGITTPTKGSVVVRGKVAPLIEVGAGLIGDLTGRENIYLNATILGLARKEIDRKLDEIIAFAELEEFIDTPIKRYSSGMSVRLGFSIATSVESDILIVDEVLAVGDLAFQRKCFDRMESLIKRQGKTVLLVSHNIRQVERICSRVMLINQGKILSDGEPQKVCNLFYEQSDEKIQSQTIQRKQHSSDNSLIQNTGELELLEICMLDKSGNSIDRVGYLSEVTIKIIFKANEELVDPTFGIGAHTPDLLFIASDDSIFKITESRIIKPGIFHVAYHIPKMSLLPGAYAIRLGAAPKNTDRTLFYGENLCHFRVYSDTISHSRTVNQGFVSFGGRWIIQDSSNSLIGVVIP